jgi:L-ascorbate metabolism protein UlaG (beta-lactamase superfamily)
MKTIFYLFASILILASCKSENKDPQLAASNNADTTAESAIYQNKLDIIPISHATMVIDWDGTIIYVDPVGGAAAFGGQPPADLILVTDIHGDHLDLETLKAVSSKDAVIVGPEAVTDEIGDTTNATIQVLYNGTTTQQFGITIEAIPMYNLREEALKFHYPGRGNGYVLEMNGKRIYISGDTEDIPEMRSLKNIDMAFVCMNLPYTMTVESAADAVLEFKPKMVYPYHYRGTDGLSDVDKFKELVRKGDKNIQVVQLNWYPSK